MRRILIASIVGVVLTVAAVRASTAADGPDGHTEAGGHAVHVGTSGASTDPSEFKGDLAIFTFIVFLLLLAILWKFAWGPISAGLEKREHGIAEHIAAAQRSHEEGKRLLAEYERKLASAQDDVRAILDEARRDAAHTQQEILAQARADAAAEMDRAKREVETARDQALKQLVETGANLAVELAGRILRAELTPARHAQLINEAVAKFPKHDPSRN
ncbi:MAG TPA: F0F1 ATP synthase subunit B [Pirellulales bacterium]|nr:F0F1 ATP synthase subunit B [Pirellulales bacterium]